MRSGRLTLLLLLTAMFLGALAAASHWAQSPTGSTKTGRATAAVEDAAAGAGEGAEVSAPSLPPLAALDQTIQRPLFSATRRPPEPQKQAEAPTQQVAAPVRATPVPATELSAVIIYGETKVALLKNPAGGGLIRKRVGDEIEGWRLDSIDALAVVLQSGANRHELPLRTFKAAPLRRTPSTVKKKGDDAAAEETAAGGRRGARRSARELAAERARAQADEELDPEALAELEAEDPELLDAELEAEAERVREAIERRRERRARRQ